jgi:hypothetical protein
MTSTKYGQLFQLNYTKPLALSASSAVVIPGGKMYFWAAGSFVTPQAVYADASLYTALSNPVVADSYGRFAPIYLNPALQYNWSLTNAAGTNIRTASAINVPNPSQPVQLVEDTTQGLASTTTLTPEPTLLYAIPVAGTYKVELYLYMEALTSGATPGIKLSLQYSGGLNASAGNCLSVTGFLNSTALTAAQSAVAVNGTLTGSLGATTAANFLSIAGTIQVTSAGTLQLYWAQNASSTYSSYIFLGSSMSVTQVG